MPQPALSYLPKKAPWLSTFESEVTAFPNGKHDNQVDSLTQFLRTLDFGRGPLRHVFCRGR
jgi:predicted phage terminase large subunit-like protein